VLDGGARRRQESEISRVPAALCIATRALKPLAKHSLYKLKNSSLGERSDCGGWLVALTPSRTLWPKMAQRWRARDRSRQVEWYTTAWECHLPLEGGGVEARGGLAC
jgi:hypothetical protein